LVGVISDTHGLVRPQALEALAGANIIIHAGDIGSAEVIAQLESVAPVIPIRGNNDHGEWAEKIPTIEIVEVGCQSIYVLHDVNELDLDPAAAQFAAVIAGHSHRPSVERRAGVLYVNPGSAGPRRFKLPVSVARLHVDDAGVEAELVELAV